MTGPMARQIAQRQREREKAEARERAHLASARAGRGYPPRVERWTGALREGGDEAKAALRGAGDALTFGFYDPIAAGVEATLQTGGFDGWRDRYGANLANEAVQDRHDAARHPVARAAGQVGGTLLSLAAGGPISGGARLAGAARITGRETAAWLAAHGAAGAGLQTVSDLVQGRPLSWRNDLGAAAGGAVGAVVPLPPGRAGAIGGAISSATQDMLNGRPVSLQGVADGALAGRLAGGVAGRVGRSWSNGLPKEQKGVLGEELGALRSRANGQPTGRGPKKMDKIEGSEGKHWFPDRRVDDLRYEDKFGDKAKLSTNQILAQARLGDDFHLNHFIPDDIARAMGLPAASAATRPVSRQPRR